MLSVNSALITCSTALSFRQRAKSKRNKNEFFTDIHSTSKRNIYDLRRVFPESSSQFQLTIYPLYVDSDRCCVERACVYVKRFCSRYRGHFCILKKRKNGTSDRFVPIRRSKSCEKKNWWQSKRMTLTKIHCWKRDSKCHFYYLLHSYVHQKNILLIDIFSENYQGQA